LKHRGVAQRLDHRPAVRQDIGKVAHAFLPVGKAKPERSLADRLQFDDFDDLDYSWSAPGTACMG